MGVSASTLMNIEMEKSKALLSLIRLGLGHDGGIQKNRV